MLARMYTALETRALEGDVEAASVLAAHREAAAGASDRVTSHATARAVRTNRVLDLRQRLIAAGVFVVTTVSIVALLVRRRSQR